MTMGGKKEKKRTQTTLTLLCPAHPTHKVSIYRSRDGTKERSRAERQQQGRQLQVQTVLRADIWTRNDRIKSKRQKKS